MIYYECSFRVSQCFNFSGRYKKHLRGTGPTARPTLDYTIDIITVTEIGNGSISHDLFYSIYIGVAEFFAYPCYGCTYLPFLTTSSITVVIDKFL